MARTKVVVSFDYTDDKKYYFLLKAWDKNEKFDFQFDDGTPREIDSYDVAKIKGVLSTRIKAATHTLVIVGEHANQLHKDRKEIGYDNWINWEVAKSKTEGNKLVGIKLSSTYASPTELVGSGATWALSFTEAAIVKALNNA